MSSVDVSERNTDRAATFARSVPRSVPIDAEMISGEIPDRISIYDNCDDGIRYASAFNAVICTNFEHNLPSVQAAK
jgi:hypothetical protein